MKTFFKLLICIILIIVIIFAINIYLNKEEILSLDEMNCIKNKSILYVSKTCSHCFNQINLITNYNFTIIDCIDNSSICLNQNITAVPSWTINNINYKGLKTLLELKKLTNC